MVTKRRMAKDLKLTTGNRYNVIALIFYVPYIIFEFPGSALVRKIGVRNQLASIVFLWGCVVIGCGFVTSWKQLAGLRVLLGFFEAGFFPACVYLLSTWYLRCKWSKSSRALMYTSHTDMSPDEVQKRYAVFYFLTINASAFGGVRSSPLPGTERVLTISRYWRTDLCRWTAWPISRGGAGSSSWTASLQQSSE